jgi:sialic acid synthase SpsE
MLKRLELPEMAWAGLREYCTACGVGFLSSPFDEVSADFLAALGVDALKIPSGELTNLPYLSHVAPLGLPLIVSTGMADLEETTRAVETIREAGNPPLALLHCVSAYPAPAEACNLRVLETLGSRFGVPVGWSDHTLGNEVALAAVALGACIVEKHFTLDRSLPGPDHAASLEPREFADLVAGIRKVESALGSADKRPAAVETETAAVARKSLVALRGLAAGERLTGEDVAARRPGTGIPPAERDRYVGRRLRVDVAAGTLLAPDMFE